MSFHKSLKKIFVFGTVFTVFNVSSVFAGSIGKINAENVNIRVSNSTEAPVISKINNGEVVTVLSHDDGWFKINYANAGIASVYVSSEFVSITEAEGTINSDSVNVRTSPSTSAAVVAKLNSGQAVSVKGLAGDWYALSYNGADAYIHRDFITSDMAKYMASVPATSASETVYAIVNCSGGLNMRSNPSTDSSVISTLYSGSAVDVVEVLGGWVKVKTDDGTAGYLNSEFVSLNKGTKPAVSSKADSLIAYAKQFIGTPYAYGQANLRTGVDCSGFVYSVFKDNGITLNRSSRDQVSNGPKVEKAQLVSGDLVFFSNDGSSGISHVGIYIGDGKFIHSSSGKSWGVVISSLSEAYYIRNYITAARVL